MTDISLLIRRSSESSPEALWQALRKGAASGWPFLRECRRFEVGAALLFSLPGPRGGTVQAAGRIVGIDSVERSVTVAQEAPWEGTVTIRLAPAAAGSEVVLSVTMAESSVSWFLQDEEEPSVPPLRVVGRSVRDTAIRIGLLVPLSGITGILGRSIANAALLAVEELNQSAAFGRRHVERIVEDDRTSPAHARTAFERLVVDRRCDVVLLNVSSASVEAIRPLATARGALVLNTALTERHPHSQAFVHLGESPHDQLWNSIPRLMADGGTRNWYILGNDYVWPRTIGMVANELIMRHDGRIGGETYRRLGSTRFDDVIEKIVRSGADVILSSLVGIDAVLFEQQFHASGLRPRFRTLALNFDDTVAEHIGYEEAAGIWAVQDYFMPTLADEMDDVATRYQARFGALAPRLTSMAKAVYDGVHLYAQATQVARSFEPRELRAVLYSEKVGTARLHRRVVGRLAPTAAAEVTPSGFRRVM